MRSIIQWSVDRPVPADIFMIFLIGAGAYPALNVKRETLPEFSLDRIQVSVVYKGASAKEIEESAVIKIEEAVAGVRGVKKITSRSVEGPGSATAELTERTDVSRSRSDGNGTNRAAGFTDEY